jgi:hypothetical protein
LVYAAACLAERIGRGPEWGCCHGGRFGSQGGTRTAAFKTSNTFRFTGLKGAAANHNNPKPYHYYSKGTIQPVFTGVLIG